MEAVLLETGREARASCWSHAGLHTVEALAEELVSVGPSKLAWLILEILTCASVVFLDDDLSHEGVLHHYAGKFTDISGSRLIVLVRESMRIGIVS